MNEGNTGDNMIKSAKCTIVIQLPPHFITVSVSVLCQYCILNVIQCCSIFSYQHDMTAAKLKLQGTIWT